MTVNGRRGVGATKQIVPDESYTMTVMKALLKGSGKGLKMRQIYYVISLCKKD